MRQRTGAGSASRVVWQGDVRSGAPGRSRALVLGLWEEVDDRSKTRSALGFLTTMIDGQDNNGLRWSRKEIQRRRK